MLGVQAVVDDPLRKYRFFNSTPVSQRWADGGFGALHAGSLIAAVVVIMRGSP